VTRADHQIEAVQVEELDRRRKERQELAVEPRGSREPLYERGPDPPPLDRLGHLAAGMDEAEKRGVRVEIANRLQHLLSTPHTGEPVVNQRDTHVPAFAALSRHQAHVCSTSL
jgi:hypothetical protein